MPYVTQECAPKQITIPVDAMNENGEYILPRGAKIGTEIPLNEEAGVYGILRNNIDEICCEKKDCAYLDLIVCCGDCPARPLMMALKKCVSGVKKFGAVVNMYNDGEDATCNSYNVGGEGKPMYYVFQWGVEDSNKEIWVAY